MKNYLIEFIGTMFWVMVIGFSGNPLAIGLTILAAVYIGAHISGAHYNPAITLAFWFRKKIKSSDVLFYWIAQLLGAFAGAVIYYIIQEKSFCPAPAEGVELWKCILLELLFTFLLCTAALTTLTTKKLENNFIYGLAIGSAVAAGIYCVGPITGGVFNPAVYLGPMITDSLTGGSSIQYILLYLIGPFGGSALAAIVYGILNPEEFQE
jgi:MIP family channel proteins